MRMLRSRRGEDHPVWFLMFEIVTLVMFAGIMSAYAYSIAEDSSYWREHYARDISYLTTILEGAPGDAAIYYTTIKNVKVRRELVFEISTANVPQAQYVNSIRVSDKGFEDRPTYMPFGSNRQVSVTPVRVENPGYLQIEKKKRQIAFLFDDAEPLESCPEQVSTYDPVQVTFSFQGTASELDRIVGTAQAAPSGLRKRLPDTGIFSDIAASQRIALTQDRMEDPASDIALLFEAEPAPANAADASAEIVRIDYGKNEEIAAAALACMIGNEMRARFSGVTIEKRAVAPYDYSDPSISSFFSAAGGVKVRVLLPSSYVRPADAQTEKIRDSITDATAVAIASLVRGGSP